jgi:hypothetical protein
MSKASIYFPCSHFHSCLLSASFLFIMLISGTVISPGLLSSCEDSFVHEWLFQLMFLLGRQSLEGLIPSPSCSISGIEPRDKSYELHLEPFPF